jgi:hypothetical protein
MSEIPSEELMAWLQDAFRARDRVQVQRLQLAGDVSDDSKRANFRYGISASDGTIDMDYQMDEWTVSLIRITAVEREGKTVLEMKRFAGPRGEAYDEANEWRDSLRPR